MRVKRFPNNPIVQPGESIGSNINGPSLIRAPGWLEKPLGKYYLYFAHHRGRCIRLAYADSLNGLWSIYEPGTLRLDQTHFQEHIASPDVHVDHENHRFLMYFHGVLPGKGQFSSIATSSDGIHFTARPEILGQCYFRVFKWKEYTYALAQPGIFYRSRDGLSDFQEGPTLFTKNIRHTALKLDEDILSVFYSNIGDAPERILLSTIELTPDWMTWSVSEPQEVLEPELDYEGADLPIEPSVEDWAPNRVRQLRDPAVFQEGGRTYLLYSIAGERGIAMAEFQG